MNGTTGYEAQFSWKWVFGVDGFLCMDGVLGHVFGFGLPLACLVEFDSIEFQFQDYLWLLSSRSLDGKFQKLVY